MKITAIRLIRLNLPLDPPFSAAWDPVPRRDFPATLVQVETDAGLIGVGSGDTMDGFDAYEDLFIGTDPLQILNQVRRIETINFHGGRYWPLEAALWDIIGQVAGLPVSVLFGGARDRLTAYASCGELKPAGARAESALAARERGFVLYPGKLTQVETFRVGCIGAIGPHDMAQAVYAIARALQDMGIASATPAQC